MLTVKRQPRVVAMLVLTALFFLLEIVVGEMTGSCIASLSCGRGDAAAGSVALVADSFHMLSDLIALLVSLQAIRLAKRRGPTKTNTYGWQRAEQLGALVNGVFLIALSFTIFVEAIQRFISPVGKRCPGRAVHLVR